MIIIITNNDNENHNTKFSEIENKITTDHCHDK